MDEQLLRQKYGEIFKNRDGSPQNPYDYQIRVVQHLLAGKSVILQAPTGAGKTNTALFPFLYARQFLMPKEFPHKMIYSVERRILVNSFHADVKELKLPLETTILTGERAEDPDFSGNLVFTTIDQTLSSFLMSPFSLTDRKANLNAGAIASSYLVFDEAHLFDSETALPTLMWMLKALKGIVPSLVMTATFSKPLLRELAEITGGVVETVQPDELKEIPAQETKKRYFQAVDTALTAEAVLNKHQTRSIVVCNTVDRAQELFSALEEKAGPDTKLVMLHARFLQTDRKTKEKELLKLFGRRDDKEKTDTSGSAILVATQVIEVGVDITCENLHTELAPANTILQRAGRCARHPKEEGTVYVYHIKNALPYKEDLFAPTFEGIKDFGIERVTFDKELKLIDDVHTAKDGETVTKIKANASLHGDKVKNVINDPKNNSSYLRDLIRDVDSRTILVHSNPETLENPYDYESFSIFDGSFRGKITKLLEEANARNTWAVKYPVPKEDKEQIERRPTQYKWEEIKTAKDVGWHPLVVVNPVLVTYDSKRGFLFKPGGDSDFQSPEIKREKKQYENYDYQLETYAEHIRNVNGAYGYFKFEDEIAFAVARLQEKLGVAPEKLDHAIRLSFVFHDAGKLTEGWQNVVHKWQSNIIQQPPTPDKMLAHTDFVWQKHNQLVKSYQRPPHAVEGAYMVKNFLYDALGKHLYRPVVTAIARHHSPTASELSQYSVNGWAEQAINEALKEISLGQVWQLNQSQLLNFKVPKFDNRLIVQASLEEEAKEKPKFQMLAYMLIVRVLRLADQASFEFARVHENKGEVL